MKLFVDADACPVKDEVYRVARRYELKVLLVSNASLFIPISEMIEMVVVKGTFDAADNWIVENISSEDIAVTSDIPLAERCLAKGAKVLGPKGYAWTEENIGEAMGSRALMDMLRQSGMITGGPSPFGKPDRSRFLSKLDEMIQANRRGQNRPRSS